MLHMCDVAGLLDSAQVRGLILWLVQQAMAGIIISNLAGIGHCLAEPGTCITILHGYSGGQKEMSISHCA